MLEQQMDALLKLPDRVASLEAQFLQFRDETRGEFAAVRSEMRQQFDLLREEIRSGDEGTRYALRREMHELHADTVKQIEAVREEMRAGDEETRRHARVLHEEVIARIALLDERWNGHADGRNRTSRKTPSGRDRKR